MYQTEVSEQAKNQLNLTEDTGIQSSERKLNQQTGQIIELLEENKEEFYHRIVFLPGPDSTDQRIALVDSTPLIINELATTDTVQGEIPWLPVESLDESILFLDDLLTSVELPAQSIHPGELNTPIIDQQKGFEFPGYQKQSVITLNKFTDSKNQQLQNNQVQSELPKTTQANRSAIINSNQQAVNEKEEELFTYDSLKELLEDSHQMFHSDCEPMFFDSMSVEDNLNNNLGLEQIKDLDINYSDSWIPAPAEIEIFKDLLLDDEMTMMEKEEAMPSSPIPEPAPAPSPSPAVETGVQIKLENSEFDLIKYIIFGENAELLSTPVEEKQCPNFEEIPQPQNVIKTEPEPSTSAAPSPRRSIPEEEENVRPLRRRAQKRRYSSDSDFSINTSASSYNATTQRSSKKKRGRPAKELITDLPTVEDFSHMPIEHASHLVLRIKNNEASRKSRMKSKSKQTAMEDEFDRLGDRAKKLRTKQNKLDGQIETLRRWLLGLN